MAPAKNYYTVGVAQLVELIALIRREGHVVNQFDINCELCENYYRLISTLSHDELAQSFVVANRKFGDLNFLRSATH